MKLNLIDKQCLDLEDKEVPGGIMSNVVANMLATAKGEPIKLYELAKGIKKGEVEIDTTDFDLVEKVVAENEGYVALIKGQVLLELKEQRREAKERTEKKGPKKE